MSLPQSLAGCVVLVTSDRRSGDLRSALRGRGAAVVHAPAVSSTPPLADDTLALMTRALVARPPDVVVVTTGVGFRGWLEAADAIGLGDALRARLRAARIIARGPRTRGAVLGAGLDVDPTITQDSSASIRDALLAEGVAGRRIAIQHHGTETDELDVDLAAAGADTTSLVVHRWGPPPDPAAVVTSTERAAVGGVDAVLFTSAAAASAWLDAASEAGVLPSIVGRSAAGTLVVMTAGPAAAGPLVDTGITPLQPENGRLGSLVNSLVAHYEGAGADPVATSAGALLLRNTVAVLDGRVVPVSPGGLAVLRLLTEAKGGVVSRADVLEVLPGSSGSGHAVEVAIARLREAIGDRRVVETVVKRGYRLALA